MTGIKELPKKYRRQVLFDSARKIYAELGYQFGIDVTDYQSTDKEAANEIVSNGCSCDVIIDFSSIELLTSEGISSLIILERLLNSLGHRIVLCAVPSNIRQILERTGIQPLFEFANDEFAALQSVRSRCLF